MREHRPVIALDFPSFEAVKEFLALFPAEESLYLKVGMELYYATGPEIVSYLKGLGHSDQFGLRPKTFARSLHHLHTTSSMNICHVYTKLR